MDKFTGAPSEIFTSAEVAGGEHVWSRGYLAVSSETIPDQMFREYIAEQEGERIHHESRGLLRE